MPRKQAPLPVLTPTPSRWLTDAEATTRSGYAKGVLKKWRSLGQRGPYWVDNANPGRNQKTSHLPTPNKPCIRYPLEQLDAWLAGDTEAVS